MFRQSGHHSWGMMMSHKSEMPPGGSEVRRRLRPAILLLSRRAENPAGSSTHDAREEPGETRSGRMRVGTPGLRLRKKTRGRFQRDKARNATCWPSGMIKNVRALSGAVQHPRAGNKQRAAIELIIRLILMFLFLFCHLRISKHVNSGGRAESLWSRYKPHHAANKCFNAVLLALLPQRGSEEPGWFLSHDPTHT